jgi:hypothetical protein
MTRTCRTIDIALSFPNVFREPKSLVVSQPTCQVDTSMSIGCVSCNIPPTILVNPTLTPLDHFRELLVISSRANENRKPEFVRGDSLALGARLNVSTGEVIDQYSALQYSLVFRPQSDEVATENRGGPTTATESHIEMRISAHK